MKQMKLNNKLYAVLFITVVIISTTFTSCKAQKSYGSQYLKLEKTIPLPGVKGRIDHLDIDVKDQIVYVAALGNNSVEVVSLKQGKVIHSIKGLDEPQGVGFIPQTNEIFIANGGNGACYFYNANTFEKTATVQLASDADDVFYEPVSHKIYVGYGSGGIAAIDVNTHRQTGDVKLPAHPERFQLNKSSGKMFVNLPNANSIGVIDLKKMKLVHEWNTDPLNANFPMALDTFHHRLFVGYRRPAKLAVLDSRTGKILTTQAMAGDADDMYYDQTSERVYVSGGSGYIDIFKQQDPNSYTQTAHIPSRNGARTSLLIPQLQLFIVAARASGDKEAQLLVYKTMR